MEKYWRDGSTLNAPQAAGRLPVSSLSEMSSKVRVGLIQLSDKLPLKELLRTEIVMLASPSRLAGRVPASSKITPCFHPGPPVEYTANSWAPRCSVYRRTSAKQVASEVGVGQRRQGQGQQPRVGDGALEGIAAQVQLGPRIEAGEVAGERPRQPKPW